jgi:phosphomannomutase
MTLIKSISGIRGTIGGHTGDTLNPLDIVKFTTAYATFIRKSGKSKSNKIVVGRDGRISGEMVKNVVCGTLMGMGYDVINIGYATTPTTELAVRMAGADGGIIITASHNPRMWNALKLLNNEGEFLTAADGAEVLDMCSLAKRANHVSDLIAHVEVAEFGGADAHLLHNEGDGPGLYIGIGDGQRHTLSILAYTHDDEVPRTASLCNEWCLND